MTNSEFRDLKLSKVMLGTVQFGLDYGIANKNGQPSYEDSRGMLEVAAQEGINCLDTASLYGSSEAVIGKALKELGLQDHFTVVTKVLAITDEHLAGRTVAEFVRDSVTNSLRHLKLDVLPLCLMHREEDAVHMEVLATLRDEGLIRYIGSSTSSPAGALGVLNQVGVETIQIPTNILDQRYTDALIPEQIVSRGMALFVRSVFLQGLLLMPETSVPERLGIVIPIRRQLAELAAEAGITLQELGARYVLSLPGLTSIVVGVDSVDQLKSNVRLFGSAPLEAELISRIQTITRGLPDEVLNPALWQSARDPWNGAKSGDKK